MPLHLTRKQSMWLGLGFLVSFFVLSAITIYNRSETRVPTQFAGFSREVVEGPLPTPPLSVDTLVTSQTPGAGFGFVLNDFHRSMIKDGKTAWDIRGDRGKYDPSQSKAEITKPNLHVTRESGDTMHLTAERAELSMSGTQLSSAELFDNVVAVYKGNTTVTTSRAIYNELQGTVVIPVPVQLDSPMFALSGNRLFAKLDSQEIVITNGVTSTIKPRKK